MATSSSTGELIKVNGDIYPAWKLQVRMALIRDDLWDIVNGSEAAPDASASADVKKKFKIRSNKALSTIVLSMKPELHYLNYWKRARRPSSNLETTLRPFRAQDLGKLLRIVEAIDDQAQDEGDTGRRIGRQTSKIDARNV